MEVYNKVVTGEDLMLKPPTPGLKYKHYSPDAQVILFEGPSPSLTVKLVEQLNDLLNTQQRRVGYIHTRPISVHVPADLLSHRLLTVHLLGSEEDLGNFHSLLCFGTLLFSFHYNNLSVIACEFSKANRVLTLFDRH
jgi:hypothetical protein